MRGVTKRRSQQRARCSDSPESATTATITLRRSLRRVITRLKESERLQVPVTDLSELQTESDVEQKLVYPFLVHPSFLDVPHEWVRTKEYMEPTEIDKSAGKRVGTSQTTPSGVPASRCLSPRRSVLTSPLKGRSARRSFTPTGSTTDIRQTSIPSSSFSPAMVRDLLWPRPIARPTCCMPRLSISAQGRRFSPPIRLS